MTVRDLDDVAALVERSTSPATLIVDVDNTLAPQGSPPEEFVPLVESAIDRLEAMPGVARVIGLTNGPQRGVARLVGGGNKPWTTHRRLGIERGTDGVIVVGDQVLTDGVLAWRLGAVYARLVLDDVDEPPGQARMRQLGRLVGKLVLRTAPDDRPST